MKDYEEEFGGGPKDEYDSYEGLHSFGRDVAHYRWRSADVEFAQFFVAVRI